MKLLFQTTGTAGNTELKELLGFIDADLKLKNLIPDLNSATNDIIDLVGKEVYTKAIQAYNEGTIAEDDKEFIYAIRYPITVNAYRMYCASNDLSHTNDGRKMRLDENQKQAFEWMLDRDNAAHERRYYRALDDLIKFLDSSEVEAETTTTLYTIWTNSDAFKATHNLFIRTVADFDKHFTINSRLLLLKLAPAISDCEQYKIRPLIGTEKLNVLKQALKDNTGIADAKDLELIRLIQKASVSYALAWSMPRLSVQLYPEGVLQHVTSDKATTRGAKPSMKNEIQEARQAFESDFDKVILEIERLVAPVPTIDETQTIYPDILSGDKYMSL